MMQSAFRDRPPPIIPRPAPGIAYVEPRLSRSASFVGAALPVCGVEVLVVVVQPSILANTLEANLYVVAFQTRFHKTIVLMAQDDTHAPTYFGPGAIVRAISKLPFEIIPWRRMLYRLPRSPSWQLPIAPELSEVSSLEELATRVHDPEQMAHTTRR